MVYKNKVNANFFEFDVGELRGRKSKYFEIYVKDCINTNNKN